PDLDWRHLGAGPGPRAAARRLARLALHARAGGADRPASARRTPRSRLRRVIALRLGRPRRRGAARQARGLRRDRGRACPRRAGRARTGRLARRRRADRPRRRRDAGVMANSPTPTPTLPRKRRRELAVRSIKPPPLLAGEGWGGGWARCGGRNEIIDNP